VNRNESNDNVKEEKKKKPVVIRVKNEITTQVTDDKGKKIEGKKSVTSLK